MGADAVVDVIMWDGELTEVLADDASVVDNVSNFGTVRHQFYLASEPRQAMGCWVLDVRRRDNDLRDAGPHQVTLCQCGQELKTIDDGGHVRTVCCNQIIEGCCGDF